MAHCIGMHTIRPYIVSARNSQSKLNQNQNSVRLWFALFLLRSVGRSVSLPATFIRSYLCTPNCVCVHLYSLARSPSLRFGKHNDNRLCYHSVQHFTYIRGTYMHTKFSRSNIVWNARPNSEFLFERLWRVDNVFDRYMHCTWIFNFLRSSISLAFSLCTFSNRSFQ